VLAVLQSLHIALDPALTPYVPIAVGWIAGVVTWLKLRAERGSADIDNSDGR
jgi:hypothetical protein